MLNLTNGGLLETLWRLPGCLLADFTGILPAIEQSSAGRLAAFSRPSGNLWAAFWGLMAAAHALTGCIWWQSVDEENVPWQAGPL